MLNLYTALYLCIRYNYLARSSFTHFSGPLATTVAARGRSSNSAISPETRFFTNITVSGILNQLETS